MKLWLIAVWRSIPPKWIVVSAPFVVPVFALAIWFLLAGIFAEPPDQRLLANAAEFERVLPLAVKGNLAAQVRAGVMLRDGLTGDPDYHAARGWFEKAAKRGFPKAQFYMGDLYDRGLGVRQDFVRAAEWYRVAAGFGRSPESEFALGELFYYGRGVPQQYDVAITWYRKAAIKGLPTAQYVLAGMYENGWGVRRNLTQAYVWFARAAEKADAVMVPRRSLGPVVSLAKLEARMGRLELKNARRILGVKTE